MADKESLQIVRPWHPRDYLPVYETKLLLCGVSHFACVPGAEERKRIERAEIKCPQNHDLIVKMLRDGSERKAIAEKIGVDVGSINKHLRKHMIGGSKNFRQIARDNAEEIRALHAKGMIQRDIAAKIGTNRMSVNNILSGLI